MVFVQRVQRKISRRRGSGRHNGRMTTPRLGLAFVPTHAPEELHDIAVAADNAGLDDLWVWEDSFKESGVASATAALAWTTKIRVGIGLLPTPLRTAAVAAMEIATISRMFPGRFVPGIGHGVQEWMEQAGVRVASPMTLLSEYTYALRDLLAGEKVTVDGRYIKLTGVQLDFPPLVQPPFMIGGTGPKTLDFCGKEGDGTLLGNSYTDEELENACTRILAAHRGREGERVGQPHEIVYTLITATGADGQSRVDREVALWGAEAGLGVGIAGDAAAIAATVHRLASYGVTTVVIQPTEDEPNLTEFIRFIGEEVRPLL